MGDQTDEQKRYHSNVNDLSDEMSRGFENEAKKVEPHKGEDKVTTSTEGTVETTTHEKKA